MNLAKDISVSDPQFLLKVRFRACIGCSVSFLSTSLNEIFNIGNQCWTLKYHIRAGVIKKNTTHSHNVLSRVY